MSSLLRSQVIHIVRFMLGLKTPIGASPYGWCLHRSISGCIRESIYSKWERDMCQHIPQSPSLVNIMRFVLGLEAPIGAPPTKGVCMGQY